LPLLLAIILMVFDPTPKQAEALELLRSPAKHVFLYGGTRSGKTAVLAESIIYRALRYPGSRHLAARLRFAHAKTSLFHETFTPALKELPSAIYNINKTDHCIEFINGSEIWIGGFDDADRIEKILGHEYSTVFFNEISQIDYKTVTLGMTRLAQNIPWCINKAFYDCNPPSPLHWSFKQFILKQDPKDGTPLARPELYASLRMNPFDNLSHLPENYISDFLDTLPARERARMRDGEFVKTEGVIYDQFDESMIIPASKLPAMEYYSVGLDFGMNSVAILCGFAGESVYIVDEICLYNSNAAILNQAMIERWKDKKYVAYCDPSGGERVRQIYGGRDALNSVEPGIDCIRNLMHRKNFWIVETCRNTIDGIATYRRDEKERIVKENDHEMDAMRYGIFSHKAAPHWRPA